MATVLSPQLRPANRANSISWLSNSQFSDYQASRDLKLAAPGYPSLVIRIESVQASPTATPTQAQRNGEDFVPVLSSEIPFTAPSTAPPTLLRESYVSAATRLQKMIKEGNKLIICPGVYDGFSARIAMSLGFDALYMTGAGTTASRLGMADLGIAQLHDMAENAEMIANLEYNGPPLIADMDTGYGGGGPIMVARAVQKYITAGVAGFHLEDQVQQKRCGHLAGKEVVDLETYLQRVRAARSAIDYWKSDIVLIARTDALQPRGYEECLVRMKAARDLGADVGIIEGFTTKEQAADAVKQLAPWPLLLNAVENGVSPVITTKEAQDMGFRIMIFSFASLAPAYVGIKNTLERIRDEGIAGTGADLTPKKMFEVCGLKNSIKIDEEAGGQAFAKGV